MRTLWLGFLCAVSAMAFSQPAPGVWQMQESGTTAGLRGIDSVDGTVAWASGTGGTVLKTVDGGAHWTKCAVPDGAKDGATLDFRGVQAWDATTAIVMASGPGEKSRLYKTADGCRTWTRVITNPDEKGFWDAVAFTESHRGFLFGDQIDGRFVLYFTLDQGKTWGHVKTADLGAVNEKVGGFAASNSAMTLGYDGLPMFGTSGPGGPWLYLPDNVCTMVTAQEYPAVCFDGLLRFEKTRVPLTGDSAAAGIFSLAVGGDSSVFVAVGGDYNKPKSSIGTAAWSGDLGQSWTASTDPPHGYRSTVQWSTGLKVWITAGTNGSDISRDDGRTWQSLDDGNWNALSLPFLVGPSGRIARLNPSAVPAAK